jgi:hypothetical protein
MRNRQKPNNKGAYASNGTHRVTQSIPSTPSAQELAKLPEPTPQAIAAATEPLTKKVVVLKQDSTKAEVIQPQAKPAIEDKKKD